MVKRATRIDWERAALGAMAAAGVRALAIPALARSLGVTKGSFYWHFRGIDELLAGALQRWEEMDREALAEVSWIADPRARLQALFVQSMAPRRAHELLVRLSGEGGAVAITLRRLSDRRLEVLVDAYRELGLSGGEARARALLAYAAYVGALHLRHQGAAGLRSEEELAAYVAQAVKTLIPRRQHAAPATRQRAVSGTALRARGRRR